ncbi:cystathionine beta-lyase [Croceivirga lutea]|uniref:cystathionine gamma-synthase n=1 Tax=Croceivirga lutea TaxID=1775167 RepID=UPI00163B0F8F|nr:cystathionine gamma-synthase [Croceivirga lutea]GGG37556.1 cystathionine beta-lyase [Croceivirga lutea]
MKKELNFNSKAIHGGQEPDIGYGAVMPPIYQTSTFAQDTPGNHKGYAYARSANPTRTALENSVASLENGAYGLAFASGMAAIDAILKLCQPGDEIIAVKDIYGGSFRLFTKIYEGYGIKFSFVEMHSMHTLEDLISSKTKMIWVETPTNPLLNIVDIKTVSKVAKKHSILVAVDNTFATPYLQQPLNLGADIVMHSATKYLGGHSDVVVGAVVVNNKMLADKLYFIQNASGAICGPMDAFLTLRGIKTLHVRMQRHAENTAEIAKYLKHHSKVTKVFWPGFKSHPNHKVAKAQMKAYGGMLSFIPKTNTIENATNILSKLKLFTLAESLGGVESLVGHPATMSHGSMSKEERESRGIVDALIRLSVGIEHVSDLIDDLEQALR